MTSTALIADDIAPGAESRSLAAFTRRVIEIAALSRSCLFDADLSASPLNILSQAALLIDREGLVVDANSAADALDGSDITLRQRRLFIRDAEARQKLRLCIEQFDAPAHVAASAEPIIVPRQDSLPFLMRLWPIEANARWPAPSVRALITLNTLGPRPGPPAALLAKTFSLTPSEAKLACIIARGAGPDTAAAELNISRETARNQLKSIFAKTATHRQGELVALLLQV